MSAIDEIKAAISAVHEAEQELRDVTREQVPIGALVLFRHGNMSHDHEAEVLRHGWGARVFVRNIETGRERWICVSALTAVA